MAKKKSNIIKMFEFKRKHWNKRIDRLVDLSFERPLTTKEKVDLMFLLDEVTYASALKRRNTGDGRRVKSGPL